MRVNVLPGTRFHSTQLIEKLDELHCDVKVYSSSPKKNFKTQAKFSYRFVPQIAVILDRLFKTNSTRLEFFQNKIYDELCKLWMRECEVLHGWAGLSLKSGVQVRQQGGVYILERSCPHILFQEELIEKESEKLEVKYEPKPKWWIERSLREYEEAHTIVTPSEYTLETFLRRGMPINKLRKIPLDKIIPIKIPNQKFQKGTLTVGTIVGNPLRKGLIYLLEAWENLKLSNARLIIKMNPTILENFPILKDSIRRQSNIEVRGFYPNLSEFYHECDLFVLPSVDDGFGLVVTEALAHGLPCIATDHVGSTESFKGSSFVRVVPAGDSEAIAGELLKIYENQEELRNLRDVLMNTLKTSQVRKSGYELGIEELYRSFKPKALQTPAEPLHPRSQPE